MEPNKNEKAKNAPPAPIVVTGPEPAPLPVKGEPIRCRVINFDRPTNIPGGEVRDSVPLGATPNQKHWIAFYIPQMRHFQIQFFQPSKSTPASIGYVHESKVASWEPAP